MLKMQGQMLSPPDNRRAAKNYHCGSTATRQSVFPPPHRMPCVGVGACPPSCQPIPVHCRGRQSGHFLETGSLLPPPAALRRFPRRPAVTRRTKKRTAHSVGAPNCAVRFSCDPYGRSIFVWLSASGVSGWGTPTATAASSAGWPWAPASASAAAMSDITDARPAS